MVLGNGDCLHDRQRDRDGDFRRSAAAIAIVPVVAAHFFPFGIQSAIRATPLRLTGPRRPKGFLVGVSPLSDIAETFSSVPPP